MRQIVGGMLLLGFASCKPNEEISKTTEPRVDFGKHQQHVGDEVKPDKIPTRILGAIAAAGDEQSWFFKMMGPAEAIGQQEPAFDRFLSSVQFTDKKDKPVTWILPDGWSEGQPKGRYATIRTGPTDDAVELTVMQAGGDLLGNVNRWLGQVSEEPVTQDSLSKFCREMTTKQGKKVTRVDVSGMAKKGPAMPPFMRGK